MVNTLFGNKTAEKVLLYMANYKSGYATKIARIFNVSLNMVQKQLNKLEEDNVLVSKLEGQTRIYQFNPRFFLKEELLILLNKILEFMPEEEKQKYYRQRTRPRRRGKPL